MNKVHNFPPYISNVRLISSHLCLGLPSDLFSSVFPTQILYAFLNSFTSPRSCVTYHNKQFSLQWGLLSPSPTHKDGIPTLCCLRPLISNIRNYPPYLEDVSFVGDPRMRHAIGTGTHLMDLLFHSSFWIVTGQRVHLVMAEEVEIS
jgi:hypothetical protein